MQGVSIIYEWTGRRPELLMGLLVNGVWQQEEPPDGALRVTSHDGSFVRPESGFRDRVARDGSSGFKAEAGRYVLVTASSCPWAHRTVLTRKLKGLEDAIAILQSDLPKGEGWAYSRGLDDIEPIGGVFHVHQVYTAARSTFTGRAAVPVLWDRKTRTIVNNESSEIVRMLNLEFDEFGDGRLIYILKHCAAKSIRSMASSTKRSTTGFTAAALPRASKLTKQAFMRCSRPSTK